MLTNEAPKEQAAEEFLISGKVQGVGFRFHTQIKARQLGIVGDVVNLVPFKIPGEVFSGSRLSSGQVRVRAIGTMDRLDALHRWLGVGPSNARVDSVQRRSIPWFAASQFLILTDSVS